MQNGSVLLSGQYFVILIIAKGWFHTFTETLDMAIIHGI